MTLLVRRCFQCSAGKSKNVSSASASFSKVVTAFGYFVPYSAANLVIASRACLRVSAYITSCSAAFTRGWSRFGSLSRMWPSLRSQSRCSRVFSHTSPHGDPEAEGAIAHDNYGWAHTSALQIAENGLPAFGALAVAVLDRDQLLGPVRPHADHHERAEPVVI